MAALLAALGVGGAEVPAVAGATGATGASLAIPTGVGQAATTGLLGSGGALGVGDLLPQAGMSAMHGIEQLARAFPPFALGGARGITGLPPEQFGWNPQTIGNIFGQFSRPQQDPNQDQTLALLLQEVFRRRGMV